MKIGIVGCGMVGSTAAYSLIMRGVGREIVLVDKFAERAEAEANDLFHAVPFAEPLTVRAGQYADLAGAKVVVIAAGVNQKPGETRLQLLERNAAVFAEVVPSILAHAPEAVLVVATNPVDVMTHLTAHFASQKGVPSSRVIGSGTTLDTARFRTLLGQHLQIDSHHVHGYVVGEHGDTEVLSWSIATVGGLPVEDFASRRGRKLTDEVRQDIDTHVRRAAYQIIAGKGATYYGIGSALARIVDVILHDQRAILTVCTPHADVLGIENVTLALPQIIGGAGKVDIIPIDLSSDEQTALRHSATVLKEAITSLKLPGAE